MTDVRRWDPHLGLVGYAGLRPSGLVVVGADFLLDHAATQVKTGRASLQQVGPIGSIRQFASPRVADELRWNYQKAARRLGADSQLVLSALQEDYVPHLRVVDLPGDDEVVNPQLQQVAEMDADDVDTARLVLLLAPCHVYANDKHLRIPGFAPRTRQELETIIAAGVEVARSDGTLIGSSFVVRFLAAGAAGGTQGISARLELPIWVIGLVGVVIVTGLIVWVAACPERRERAGKVLSRAGDVVSGLAQGRAHGVAILETTSFESDVAPPTESRIARCLGFAANPLRAREIHAHLSRAGGQVFTVAEVRDVLTSHPAFVEVAPHRWQLGRSIELFP